MNKRRFVLFLIVGLLTFLIGVTAAIALGGFDPLERFSRRANRHLTIPPQPLVAPDKVYKCDHTRYQTARPRTADLRYQDRSLTPPPSRIGPAVTDAPFEEESETPSTPSARR
jgi:hypothetical protein